MWQVVRELSKHLGSGYAAVQVLQIPAEQDVTCSLELTGNLTKAWLDFKPAFFRAPDVQSTG